MPIRFASVLALALVIAPSAAMADSDDDELAKILGAMMSGESALQGKKLDKALEKAAAYPLGSEKNPVRAAMPPGERAYLERLRCADGRAPAYERNGSGGSGPYGNIVDYYEVTCAGAEPVTVVIDMYHKGYAEDRPVPGFTMVPRGSKRQ